MRRLAVVPNDPIRSYLDSGYADKWLREYFNPRHFFDEVYILSPIEEDNPNIVGAKAIRTQPRELRKRLKDLKIDIVRAYGGDRPCEIAGSNRVAGIPLVVSVHDTSPNLLRDWIGKADVVWCMSQAVRQLVLTKFSDERRVWLFPNRIHFDYMKPYDAEATKYIDAKYPFRYRILHVGRKVRQKNLDSLIKALSFLGEEYCLLAVGAGDVKEYSQIAEESMVLSRVFFVESIHNEELGRYFSWADCMCLPSRWEGFCMAIIEALACEAMVVVSDIPENAEAVQHEQNGLLIKEFESPRAIADAIRRACTDQELRKRAKANARKSVERFEQSRVDALEVEYYQKVFAMRDAGAFRMSARDRLLSSSVGSVINAAIPVFVKRAIVGRR